MSNYKKETENSSCSSNENRLNNLLSDMIEQNKQKKKLYYLYKNGTKYIVKKKEKGKNSFNEIKYNKNIKLNIIEKQINEKLISKYNSNPVIYNTIIVNRIMRNISCHIVAIFKEYLIYGEIYDFLTKYNNKRKSLYLLKEIIKYYIDNNIIYPNYMVLPEGDYIFKNIQQKQRIIDTQEENLRNKNNKDKDKINDEDNILTSKVMDSILNQTDTSEARNCFGISNKSINENDDSQVNLLIENIDKAEDINNKKQIFYKKKLIRIVNNNNDIKGNTFFKMCKFINKNNFNLYFTLKNDDKNNNNNKSNKELFEKDMKNTYSSFASKKSLVSELFSTISHHKNLGRNNINLIEKTNNNINNLANCVKMNTIEANRKNIRKKFLSIEPKEDNSNMKTSLYSSLNSHSPYIIKRPAKENISLNKRNIDNNKSYNNRIYSKKNNNFINKSNNNELSPYIKYFKTDNNNSNNNLIINDNYINSENILKNKEKKNSNLMNEINKKKIVINPIRNINTINYKDEESKTYNKIKNNKINYSKLNKESYSLNNSKNIKKHVSSNNFKSIAKMIKSKYIIDDNELNTQNNIFNNNKNKNNSLNKIILKGSLSTRNKIFNYESNQLKEDNNNSNNIFISNNITNNNYYTIENRQSKMIKSLINKDIIKNEINKGKPNKIIKSQNKNEKRGNIYYLNSESNISSSYNNNNSSKFNNLKNSITIENSKRLVKSGIMSPYKNGLINKTTLKSLDKYSLKHLLNKFNDKSNYSKEKSQNKNKLLLNINSQQINNNNKYKTVENQNNTKDENKIRLKKKKYLILRDNKNLSNIRYTKKSNRVNNFENNLVNQKDQHLKIVNSFNENNIKNFNLSSKNNNRNNKIKFYD